MLKRLIEERDRMRAEIAAMQAKLQGLEYAISVSGGTTRTARQPKANGRSKRGSVRERIVGVLKSAGKDGATLADVLSKAPELKRPAVAVALSQMKKKGEVKHAGKKYTLAAE